MEKTAVVTGAIKGIGRQIALELSKAGYNILLNYRTYSEEVEETVKAIQKNGVKAAAFSADISDFQKSKEMIEEAMKLSGTIDLLINNAGITKDKLLARMAEEDFDQVMDINLKGTFNCIRHVSRIMMKQKSGKIINITSVIGRIGNLGQANYAASKAGVIGLTRSVAKEMAPYGITVNAVAPGFIKTSMTEILSDEVKENILSAIPLKRIGNPEDVAKVVRFLASDNADYITGQVLNVDGGMVMS